MDTGVLKIVGEFGGIGGLVLGVLLLLFKRSYERTFFQNCRRLRRIAFCG